VIPLSLEELRSLRLGRLESDAATVTGVEIDSRRAGPGDLFVALGGGIAFVDDARAHGAAATLVPDDGHVAMAALGRAVRTRSDARVVGITGSSGKTSTKDILAALCHPVARTIAAEGGHNNEIGLPLTLTRIDPDTEVVITEMGMRGLGQIAELCAIAQPHIGLISSIGPVHLELVGTVENVARAKAEVVTALPDGGTAIVPAGVPELEPFLARNDIEVVRFGPGGDVDLESFDPGERAVVSFGGGDTVELPVPFTARMQAANLVGALAAYRSLGLPLDRAAEGSAAIVFSPLRCEESPLPGGGLLINDAYNANPASMRAALEHLVDRAQRRRTVAVIGEMAELGSEAPRFHEEIGRVARELGVDVVVGVGELGRRYEPDEWAADAAAAVAVVRRVVEPGDAVLVKASRAVALEVVAESLAGAAAC
jgi:UDP-N-acetylmuramoyl-tripeptide--D-alanyl-D-alanine ligase